MCSELTGSKKSFLLPSLHFPERKQEFGNFVHFAFFGLELFAYGFIYFLDTYSSSVKGGEKTDLKMGIMKAADPNVFEVK